ncbi:PEBP-like protein [Phanerochaete sordida]|uniref:PEBP-like protein n=1 Tax=Phanerochaete sordida TaxID=48140 RepID=A0A9P3LKF0_9APHY|nr:PEBP-like protein [Phanerochaete sordida]
MRFTLSTTWLLCGLVSVLAQDTSLKTVEAAFEKANIPADLHITFKPSTLLEVTFPQATGPSITIHASEQLPRNATVGPPHFAVRGVLPATRDFVVATVDPDAPTPADPTVAQIRHFLAGNFVRGRITGLEQVTLVNETVPLSGWQQPTPPAGSPAHRYIFLLFEQPKDFNSQTFVTPNTSISNFNISQFAQEVGLGNPIAGSFMLVAPDPSS